MSTEKESLRFESWCTQYLNGEFDDRFGDGRNVLELDIDGGIVSSKYRVKYNGMVIAFGDNRAAVESELIKLGLEKAQRDANRKVGDPPEDVSDE